MMTMNHSSMQNKQHGGMILGVIIGVLVGLGVALAVAVYVMKVPTPFNNKGTSRSAAQDAAEAKKNKDWDPNAALAGKPAVKPEIKPDTQPEAKPNAAVSPQSTTPAAQPPREAAANKPSQPAAAATPTASGLPATTTGGAEIEYFVQVGAYRGQDEAEAMRGKLALSGFEGKIVEREQSGRTVYRVRTGPFTQAASEKAKTSLEAAGFETVLVRSQK